MTYRPLPEGRHLRPRNGKIARLPEATRERINRMLDDGVWYRDIIRALAEPGSPGLPYPISEMNLSNWRKGGFQEWYWCRLTQEVRHESPAHPAQPAPSIQHQLQSIKNLREERARSPTRSVFAPNQFAAPPWRRP